MSGWVKRAAYRGAVAAAGLAGYMLYESQWLRYRETDLSIPGLPAGLAGLRILHLSDIHAGWPSLNMRTLAKAVRESAGRHYDLVVVSGDVTNGGPGTRDCLRTLALLKPRLGVFMVPGNHEYGLSKNPLIRANGLAREGLPGYLRDDTVRLTAPSGTDFLLSGADYVTRGFGLLEGRQVRSKGELFSMLLTHRPPAPGDPLLDMFPLVFAGHTHGGQIRLPTPFGMIALHRRSLPYTEGVHRTGGSTVVISRGLGTTFVPFRLLTRPEAVIFTLRPEESP